MIEIKHKRTGKVWLRVAADTLTGIELPRVDLREVDLRGADLRGANFSDWRRAELWADYDLNALHRGSGANVSGADLTGANLSDADLTRALRVSVYGLYFRGVSKNPCRSPFQVPTPTICPELLIPRASFRFQPLPGGTRALRSSMRPFSQSNAR
jgi:hypothetical protein